MSLDGYGVVTVIGGGVCGIPRSDMVVAIVAICMDPPVRGGVRVRLEPVKIAT